MRPDLHPACAAWPALSEADLAALAADIKANGLIDPIMLMPDGKLLDGRSRWDACETVGVKPRTDTYQGDDPVGFVISKNKLRRHMTKGGLALVAEKLATLPRGGDRRSAAFKVDRQPTLKEVADQAGLDPETLKRARFVNENAAPNVIALVRDGKVGVNYTAEALREKPTHDEQATWKTGADVRAARNRHRERVSGDKPTKQAKPRRQPKINPPRQNLTRLTHEETGFPVDGDMHQKDAHQERYGRTPLAPQDVTHRLEGRAALNDANFAIRKIASASWPTPEAYLAEVDALAAWTPDRERGGSWATNFAKDAEQILADLDHYLDTAVVKLTALQAAYRARKEAA